MEEKAFTRKVGPTRLNQENELIEIEASQMKIRKLLIENLRGLSHVECDFDKSVNVIVGPNAIGKTTVLEAIRMTKALLMPRYFGEGQQVLVSLGAISPHPQLGSYLEFGALARDTTQPIRISMDIELSIKEVEFIKSIKDQVAFELLKGQMGRNDEQSQFALTQFLSSPNGQQTFAAARKDAEEKLAKLQAPHTVSITLTVDNAKAHIGGTDIFYQTIITLLDRQCPPHQALMSYFPADRAFPTGEVNVQIGSAEASNQIQSHIGQAAQKYQRLKQTIVNNLLLSGVDQSKVQEDFQQVLQRLLPGKELVGISVTPVGTLKVSIRELASGKVFDIDSMSSGEKGLILTFMLLRRSIAPSGIALLDEPELHLNPAVCKNIVPFLSESVAASLDVQILLCTHSAEILGSAFDHPDCSIHHLRSHKDATKIYKRDHQEVFDALRRLGTTAAETLFARGNIFVEGEHDATILTEGFYDQVMGYKITSLGGRKEVEKEIATLQAAEEKCELDKLNCFIFDLDRLPAGVKNSDFVKVLQWDRYCLENYLINRKLLFDELSDIGAKDLGSRGTFELEIVELALAQLRELVAKVVYSKLEPENPGVRPADIGRKSYPEIADVLVNRLVKIKSQLEPLNALQWKNDFVRQCEEMDAQRKEQWRNDWWKLCSGKQLIDDIYRKYIIPLSKFDLKRRLAKRMKSEQTEDWTLVRSKIRDALECETR